MLTIIIFEEIYFSVFLLGSQKTGKQPKSIMGYEVRSIRTACVIDLSYKEVTMNFVGSS